MTLARIAADMRHAANQRPGRLHPRVLKRGLRLTIQRQGESLTLTAARPGVYPSADEAKIVTAAFRVPVTILAEEFTSPQWDGYRWEWPETAPPVQPIYKQIPLIAEEIR